MISRKTGEPVSINHHGWYKRSIYARMHNVMSIDDRLALRYTAGSDNVLVFHSTYTLRPSHRRKKLNRSADYIRTKTCKVGNLTLT